MNETKILKRYISRYLLVGLLILLGSVPFAYTAYNNIHNYIITQNITKLDSGITELENNIEKMQMISNMIGDNQNLCLLKNIEGKIPADSILYLNYLTNQMFDIQYLYDFSSMFFVMFHNNDAFVSTGQVSDKFTQYYGEFFEMEGLSASEFKDMIFDRKLSGSFILVNHLKYHLTNKEIILDNAILYVLPIEVKSTVNTNKAVIVFIIDEKKLVETLLTKECLESGSIRITDKDGNVFVSYGNASDILNDAEGEYIKSGKETLKILKYGNLKKGLQITVGFPMTPVYNQMQDMIRLMVIYAGVGIIVALLIVIAFLIHWYGPFSDMIKEVARLENSHGGGKNEFDYVRESLLKLVSAKDELETKMLLANAQKQAIQLENIFIKGFYKREEEEEFLKSFPFVKKGYYVACLQILLKEEEKKDTALVSAIELLKKDFFEVFIHVHSMANTEILLIPAAEEIELERLRQIFLSMTESITKQFKALCLVGISQKENEICNINVAYSYARQTLYAYKNMNISFVQFYRYICDQEFSCFHMVFLNKLYELMLCSAKCEITVMFEEAKEECIHHAERYELHKAEIFYSISFVIYAVYQQFPFIARGDIKRSKYQQNKSLVECLDILETSIYAICNRIEENRRSKKVELKEKIVQYMNHNYQRVELTAEIASKEIGISEKYLSTFIKEHTGKSFSLYQDELRIQFAKECLINTDWSNEMIAREAGFGATNSFYRVFKKYIGVSPGIYKKSKLDLK